MISAAVAASEVWWWQRRQWHSNSRAAANINKTKEKRKTLRQFTWDCMSLQNQMQFMWTDCIYGTCHRFKNRCIECILKKLNFLTALRGTFQNERHISNSQFFFSLITWRGTAWMEIVWKPFSVVRCACFFLTIS